MPRFYAPTENFEGAIVTLSAEESHHLRDVLRMRVGDEARVFDGVGHEFACRIVEVGKNSVRLNVDRKVEPVSPESSCEITIAVAMLKSDKFDFVVQKAVELGVTRMIPVLTSRSEVRSGNWEKKLVRWRRIALDASKQCGRARLMEIAEPADFTAFVSKVGNEGTTVIFSERDGSPFSALNADKKITAIFGPEGGWEDSELEIAKEKGIKVVTLAGRILRAETAAIAITAILQHRFGDLN